MSGHSHAKTIKHQKEITDKKRGQIFSKMSRLLSVAAKEGGTNPETNAKLRIAMETAKKWNLPKDNIERAIKKGSGELTGEKLEEFLFEGYGPEGIALMIEGITDNKNRTLGEVKKILHEQGGKLVGEGAVKWMFERKGSLTVNGQDQNKEDLELMAIEAGADDVIWEENNLIIYTKPEELEKVKKSLEEKGKKIESVSLEWVPKEEVALSEKGESDCQKLFEALDENDSVQDVYSNLKI